MFEISEFDFEGRFGFFSYGKSGFSSGEFGQGFSEFFIELIFSGSESF